MPGDPFQSDGFETPGEANRCCFQNHRLPMIVTLRVAGAPPKAFTPYENARGAAGYR